MDLLTRDILQVELREILPPGDADETLFDRTQDYALFNVLGFIATASSSLAHAYLTEKRNPDKKGIMKKQIKHYQRLRKTLSTTN